MKSWESFGLVFLLLASASQNSNFACSSGDLCEDIFVPGVLNFPQSHSVNVISFRARTTTTTCICDGIDELGAAVSIRRHFSLESTELILHRLRYLQQTQAHNLPQLLYDGEYATTGGEKIYATSRLFGMTLHDVLTMLHLVQQDDSTERCAAIAKVMEAPLSLWLSGFSIGNFDAKSILFHRVSRNVTIDDLSSLRRVYSSNQIQENVELDLASLLSSVDIPTSCQAEISYRSSVMKHFIGGTFRSTFSDSGCPKCSDILFQHVKPHSRITTSPEFATLPHGEWHQNINPENTMDVTLGDLGYAIVFIDSSTHIGASSSADGEEHLGVNTKEDLDEPLFTGLTRAQDPNGNVYYRASYYIYPDPSVRSARRKIHVPKEEGGQGQNQEEVRDALLRHMQKTKRQHPQYEIDQNAGKPRANLNRPSDLDDGTPLPPSPYVGISLEPNHKRTYRAHFRIGDERVDITGHGARGRDIEHVRQNLLNHIAELRQKNPGININPDYGRLKSEVETERGPLPYQYMHYLMEKNADGSFPDKRPKNKRKVFFSKDLVQAQRECHLQNIIENCEFSSAPTPFTFPRKCISFCPTHSIFTKDPTSTFNPLINEINTELLGVSMPSTSDSSQGAGPSNLEESEFSELASTLHAAVACSLLLTVDQSVMFAAFAVDSCHDMQSKMLRTGCCETSELPTLPIEVNYFLQHQHIPEEQVQTARVFSKQSYFYIYFILFFLCTYLLHNIPRTSQESIPLKSPLIIIQKQAI